MRLKETGDNIYENDAYKQVVQFALKLDADLAEKYKQTIALEEEVARLTTNMERHDAELVVRSYVFVVQLLPYIYRYYHRLQRRNSYKNCKPCCKSVMRIMQDLGSNETSRMQNL